MMINSLRRLVTCLFFGGLTLGLSQAMAESPDQSFSDLIKQHTVPLDRDSAVSEYFNYSARSVLLQILMSENNFGLSGTDVDALRNSGLQRAGPEVISPYLDEMAARIDEADNVVELALLFEKAVEAEARANAQIIEDALVNLSHEGQQVISEAIATQIAKSELERTYYSRIANDDPERTYFWMRQIVANYQASFDIQTKQTNDQEWKSDSQLDFSNEFSIQAGE